MGKGRSPGKWIKNLLLGKKSSSKSTSSKKNDIFKFSSDKDAVVSSEVAMSDPTDSLLISAPISVVNDSKGVLSKKEEVSRSLHDRDVLSTGVEEAKVKDVANVGSQEDLEKLQLTEAAIKVQAACRSYLARQAFQKLKSVIQLQAFIRGHLVRRQAVSALYCVKGIVKVQALARGYNVRRSDIGVSVQKIRKDTHCSNSVRVVSSTQAEKLSENVFVCKLVASSPYVVPLSLNGDSGEPNMAQKWLDYWTQSHFWAPLPEFKKKFDSVSDEKNGSSQTAQKGQVKKNTRKSPPVKADNGSNLGSNKSKQRLKKDSSHPLPPAQELSQKETDKSCFEKTQAHNVSNGSEVNGKRKPSNKKILDHAVTEEQGPNASSEKKKDSTVPKSKESDPEKCHEHQAKDKNDNEPHNDPLAVLQTSVKNGENEGIQGVSENLNGGDNCISNNSQRRASLPANFNDQENELYNTPVTPRLPSYMAPTESAKARLRGQGSPRLATDLVDKNSTTRRHSLSSSLNGRSGSFSPRAERLIGVSSRGGGIRSDRSLSSSRDGTEKMTQPQWRR